MGYKPQEQGFKLTNGIFYRFCMTAADHPEKDYYFIIDEINRGNMSKIFGELLMLIEKDYRGTKATLAYSSTTFSVPKNLYMIGMMNTGRRKYAGHNPGTCHRYLQITAFCEKSEALGCGTS